MTKDNIRQAGRPPQIYIGEKMISTKYKLQFNEDR